MNKHVTAPYFLFSGTVAQFTDSELRRRHVVIASGQVRMSPKSQKIELGYIRAEVDRRRA